MNPTPDAEALKLLEQAKAKLIEKYVALQDQADDLNRRIYELTVEIETLNVKIEEARAAADQG
jgi:predicted  nucleic acid-binding Zn-ribbon protein